MITGLLLVYSTFAHDDGSVPQMALDSAGAAGYLQKTAISRRTSDGSAAGGLRAGVIFRRELAQRLRRICAAVSSRSFCA